MGAAIDAPMNTNTTVGVVVEIEGNDLDRCRAVRIDGLRVGFLYACLGGGWALFLGRRTPAHANLERPFPSAVGAARWIEDRAVAILGG